MKLGALSASFKTGARPARGKSCGELVDDVWTGCGFVVQSSDNTTSCDRSADGDDCVERHLYLTNAVMNLVTRGFIWLFVEHNQGNHFLDDFVTAA